MEKRVKLLPYLGVGGIEVTVETEEQRTCGNERYISVKNVHMPEQSNKWHREKAEQYSKNLLQKGVLESRIIEE